MLKSPIAWPAYGAGQATASTSLRSGRYQYSIAFAHPAVQNSTHTATPDSDAIGFTIMAKEAADHDIMLQFSESELVLALVGAVGAQLNRVSRFLKNKLEDCGYTVFEIHISKDVIPLFIDLSHIPEDEGFERTDGLMSAGNEARMKANDNSILALGAATRIHRLRRTDANNQPSPRPKTAYIVRSLKRPEEVHRLRAIYGPGFYLVATHADHDQRFRHLVNYFHMTEEQARTLIERDADETGPHGQQVTKTFQLADFFIRVDSDDVMNLEVDRIARIIFSDPFATPSFDEFAMFMAFAGSLRSADLSRQVGAVIARDHQILAHGANDCPSFDGGLYWPRQT